LQGRLKLDQWDDKATGQKRSKLCVVGESIQFLGSKSDAPAQQTPRPKPEQSAETPPPPPDDEDDVPF
jgi:single-strand DNA-binding protein